MCESNSSYDIRSGKSSSWVGELNVLIPLRFSGVIRSICLERRPSAAVALLQCVYGTAFGTTWSVFAVNRQKVSFSPAY